MRFAAAALASAFAMAASACAEDAGIEISPEAAASLNEMGFTEFDPMNAFTIGESAMADVEQTLARARRDGKLALIILGANWCDDSQAIAARFTDTETAALAAQHYETVFVDVGDFERGGDVMRRFGLPLYYATPTVLIVDPVSARIINDHDRHHWRSATAIDQGEAFAYFSRFAEPEARSLPVQNTSLELMRLMAQIDSFEIAQAQRIEAGFGVLGDMLAVDEEERPEYFDDYWAALRGLRYGLTDDLAALRSEARTRADAGETDIELTWPVYDALPWEG